MNIADVVRALKTDIHVGDWHSGHIPRASFPLSHARGKNYKFGPDYKWRIVTFDCLRHSFRLLIILNENKEIYRTTLGVEADGDLIVLCQYEFHASEPGWHCHVTFREAESLPHGVTRTHLRRWPGYAVTPSRPDFGAKQSNAVGLATTRFRVSPLGDLGL
jgi:hypothetical protein